jgi:pyruvate formate lyase activating enzyme
LSLQEILDYLQLRRGKLQGVVITGGEPTLQEGLADFIVQIKDMGFAVKLDTNGSCPEVLTSLFERKLIDYIAMDIKSSFGKYPQLTGPGFDTDKIRQSIDLIIHSGIPYQFRTTLVKEFCSDADLSDIQDLIKGANHYVLQPFILSPKMIDHDFSQQSQYTHAEMELLKAKFEKK